MSPSRKLAIFDVDGTLVDSQAHITAAMDAAFAAADLPMPGRDEVLGIVGLSLPVGIARLAPGLPESVWEAMVAAYKARYAEIRSESGEVGSPLYPGLAGLLQRLGRHDHLLLGIATGKSKRGLDHLLAAHGLAGMFITRQVADFHPSKPHPSMIRAALAESGCAARDAVMIGDTVFDMEMGRAAGVGTIAVSWGYHPRAALRSLTPDAIVDDCDQLELAILDRLSLAA